MAVDAEALKRLVEDVGAFHVTDASLRAAQHAIESALAAGSPGESEIRGYLAAVRRYFAPFEREAQAHMRDLDKRLEHANQVVFNLTAERGVAVKRIEATGAVLTALAPLEADRS